ncbi:MAG: hypothetical protein M1572_02925 [Gammaproteobacteria bacterium]|nr:hypothetical protein [Gammaproteobacteria bacterium]
MGNYLATGIVFEMTVSKKSKNGIAVALEDVFEKLARDRGFNPALYDVIDDETETVFRLKSDLLEQQLPSFLQDYYALMYASKVESDENGSDVIAALEGKVTDEMLALAKSKSHTMFQLDTHHDMLYFRDKDFRPSLTVRYTIIILSIEGKAIMECYGTHFRFFKKCMLVAFSQHPIISTVQVFLTE